MKQSDNQNKQAEEFVYKKKKKKSAKMREGSKAEEAQDKKEGIKSKRAKKGYKTKPQGKGIVKALGQKNTTGNFKKIEAAKGKGAAIGALQNKLAAHRGQPAPYGNKKKATGKQMLSKAMKGMC